MQINWRTILRYGLLGGVLIFYFSVIGMVETFSERNLIGEFFSLGHLIVFGGGVGAAYLAVKNHESIGIGKSALIGALTAAIAAIPNVFLYIVAIGTPTIRTILVNITPNLMAFFTFGQGTTGLILFVLLLTLLGGITGAYIKLPNRIYNSLNKGLIWTIGLAIFSELVSQILSNMFGRVAVRFFFTDSSFKPYIAVIVFVLALGITYWRMGTKEERDAKEKRESVEILGRTVKTQHLRWGLMALGLLVLPWVAGTFLSQVFFMVGLYVLMGLGLNIVVGYAGLLDLGYVAFFAFGAYTMGLLTTITDLNASGGYINFWIALPISMLVAVIFGVILGFPVLRMRGDYLAIVTLGFGEIIRILALSDWLGQWMGGAQGVLKIPKPMLLNVALDTPQLMYYFALFGALLVGFISVRLRDSRLGRQWMAMREDEDVAEAMGINLISTKLLAFGIGAAFSGLAGAIFSARLSNIFPHSFNLLISVNVLSLIIVGGLGSIPGVIVGALVLVGLPELLREFEEYRLLMYGILLIVMMLNRPEGFLPAEVFKRELHADDENVGAGD